MVYQYAFIVLFNGIVSAATPLPRSPFMVGPFTAATSAESLKMCQDQRDQLLANFPHSRLVVDCFPTEAR